MDPQWEEVVALIGSNPKPPLRGVIVDRDGDVEKRRAVVMHDGEHSWAIHDDAMSQLTLPDMMMIFRKGKLEIGSAYAHGWVKCMIHGEAFNDLWESEASFLREKEHLGRQCRVVDVAFKSQDPARFWIDKENGLILRLLTVDELHVREFVELALGRPRRPPTPGEPPRWLRPRRPPPDGGPTPVVFPVRH